MEVFVLFEVDHRQSIDLGEHLEYSFSLDALGDVNERGDDAPGPVVQDDLAGVDREPLSGLAAIVSAHDDVVTRFAGSQSDSSGLLVNRERRTVSLHARPLRIGGGTMRQLLTSCLEQRERGVVAIKNRALFILKHDARGKGIEELLRLKQRLQLTALATLGTRLIRQIPPSFLRNLNLSVMCAKLARWF
jgi:hypothetical protein